jgi:hypothetical protein
LRFSPLLSDTRNTFGARSYKLVTRYVFQLHLLAAAITRTLLVLFLTDKSIKISATSLLRPWLARSTRKALLVMYICPACGVHDLFVVSRQSSNQENANRVVVMSLNVYSSSFLPSANSASTLNSSRHFTTLNRPSSTNIRKYALRIGVLQLSTAIISTSLQM